MQPGFTSKRICHLCSGEDWNRGISHASIVGVPHVRRSNLLLNLLQDWHDFTSSDAAWRHERPGDWPYKPNRDVPFHKLQTGTDPTFILPDVCHTFHIQGFGVDLLASIVVRLCQMNLVGAGLRSLDAKLQHAFKMFAEWCSRTKHTMGVRQWSKQVMDMDSKPCLKYIWICVYIYR